MMNKEKFLKLSQNYKTIIFDYGGIFVDINYEDTVRAFSKLSDKVSVDEFYETLGINPSQEATLSQHEISRPKVLGEERPKEWTPIFAFILAGLLLIELTISYALKK